MPLRDLEPEAHRALNSCVRRRSATAMSVAYSRHAFRRSRQSIFLTIGRIWDLDD
jgi:hypothetical protein